MKRGRKSEGDLTALIGAENLIADDPPAALNDRQAEIWREVVASEAKGFFGSAVTRSMLAEYCRHRESAESVSGVLSTFNPEWLKSEDGVKRYSKLSTIREKENRAAVSIATKLRLTNQSRIYPQTAARTARNAPTGITFPWDI